MRGKCKYLDGVAPGFLCLIHGDVGILGQLDAVAAVLGVKRDANAAGDRQLMARQFERLIERDTNFFRHAARVQ